MKTDIDYCKDSTFCEIFFYRGFFYAQYETLIKDIKLGKPNYSFQKRQKELAKKKKKEEKKQRKLEKQDVPAGEDEDLLQED